MHTIIDSSVLKDFFSTQPQQVPYGNDDDITCWNTFWKFIKSETDLSIQNHDETGNYNNPYFQFYTKLTSGRGNTKLAFGKFVKPYKNEFRVDDPHTFYCIDEEDLNEQTKYRRKNGLLIAFKNDYKKNWSDLKLLKKRKSLPVRKNVSSEILKGWEGIRKYILPFTDLLITDNYILSDESLIPSNLEKLLTILDQQTPTNYNLTLFSFEGRERLKLARAVEILKDIKVRNKLKANISLILTNRKFEHDRGIFMNYLRIKPGDSFNLFDSSGNIITHGTDIDFCSMADPDDVNTTKAAFENLDQIISGIDNSRKESIIYGNLKNRLLKR